MVTVMKIVTVTVLVRVTKNKETLTHSHRSFLVNPGDLADLVDLVVSNNPLYI